MTAEERARLEALWRPTLVEVDGRTYVCGADNQRPPAGGFVWLTSDEPRGRPIPPETTRERRAGLRVELDGRGWRWTDAPSHSPDGDHEELGVAVFARPLEEVLDLARAFDQLAVFLVDVDGGMDVVWCDRAPPSS